jgi:hypothetical protein
VDSAKYLDISGEWRPENPKISGSGVTPCRPQIGKCTGHCEECFFHGGRYYEDINVAHVPDPAWVERENLLVRMNDGNDSNHMRDLVIKVAAQYKRVFFNTRIPSLEFPGPVVLTVNGDDIMHAHLLPDDMPGFDRLMAVRVRTNTWNLALVHQVMDHYWHELGVPVIITFMAYYQDRAPAQALTGDYVWKKRTTNPYWCVTDEARDEIEEAFPGAFTCTSRSSSLCKDCGNCLKLYEQWRAEHA